jgi:nucleoside-diphosphate-sugar epimerase
VLNYSKAKNELRWAPKVALHDGLEQTVAFFKSSKI